MRLVSKRIQSLRYNPLDFVSDLEAFIIEIRCIDGIERDRIEVLSTLVEAAIKEINNGLRYNLWTTNTSVEAITTESKTKAGSRSSSKSTAAAKTIAPVVLLPTCGNGIADLFRDAVEAASAPYALEAGQSTVTDAAAERASCIFQSLYQHGSIHGKRFLLENKKKRSTAPVKDQQNSRNGQYSSSSLFYGQTPGLIPVELAGRTNTAKDTANVVMRPGRALNSFSNLANLKQLQTTESAPTLLALKKGSGLQRKSVGKRNAEEPVKVVHGKKGKFTTASASVSEASWLQVDSSSSRNLSASQNSSASASTSVIDTRESSDSNENTSSGSGWEDRDRGRAPEGPPDPPPVSAGVSMFTGVYPLLAVPKFLPESGSVRSGVAGETGGDVVYSAKIILLGKDVDLGLFNTEIAAAR